MTYKRASLKASDIENLPALVRFWKPSSALQPVFSSSLQYQIRSKLSNLRIGEPIFQPSNPATSVYQGFTILHTKTVRENIRLASKTTLPP